MKRIRVVGSSGSGKSTFAKELAQKLSIPVLELDSIYHLEGWTACDPEEFKTRVEEFVNTDSWVVDGNYSSVSELISSRADTFIFLDYPLPLVLFRLIRRSLSRLRSHEILWNNNRETWRGLFSWRESENLILWMLSKHWVRRRQYRSTAFAEKFPHMKIIDLRRPRATKAFLAQLQTAK